MTILTEEQTRYIEENTDYLAIKCLQYGLIEEDVLELVDTSSITLKESYDFEGDMLTFVSEGLFDKLKDKARELTGKAKDEAVKALKKAKKNWDNGGKEFAKDTIKDLYTSAKEGGVKNTAKSIAKMGKGAKKFIMGVRRENKEKDVDYLDRMFNDFYIKKKLKDIQYEAIAKNLNIEEDELRRRFKNREGFIVNKVDLFTLKKDELDDIQAKIENVLGLVDKKVDKEIEDVSSAVK